MSRLITLLCVAVFFTTAIVYWSTPKSTEPSFLDRLMDAAHKRPAAPLGGNCIPGTVWREATPEDHVCVPPATRSQAWADNKEADTRKRSGLEDCREGFVWRKATPTDHVCVPPDTAQEVAMDNAHAASHWVH